MAGSDLRGRDADDFLPATTEPLGDHATTLQIETSIAEHAATIHQLNESLAFLEGLRRPTDMTFQAGERLDANIAMLNAWRDAAKVETARLYRLLPPPPVPAADTAPAADAAPAAPARMRIDAHRREVIEFGIGLLMRMEAITVPETHRPELPPQLVQPVSRLNSLQNWYRNPSKHPH